MRVVYTDEALRDLEDVAVWLADHYPIIAPAVERRIKRVVAHIARWPSSARRVADRPDVRAASLGRYPYKIFYRITGDTIEILHIHHAARQPWIPEG
ncbi:MULTISPECIES: type II toxin-antitoxin system RelE/ParE family toxin [unclassified Bradyrhizobium]|uniref:type II toxin-antitoxin system RelE/ParE family toxin n=1 Tax=unclassified Bradyrhizobium TaxID=2631580 RepID=UPI0028E23795|nr:MULTISPECIES: type II toxin-antitoxin system RelE/ParE family toxin [unclassified Bradyrhizobium]